MLVFNRTFILRPHIWQWTGVTSTSRQSQPPAQCDTFMEEILLINELREPWIQWNWVRKKSKREIPEENQRVAFLSVRNRWSLVLLTIRFHSLHCSCSDVQTSNIFWHFSNQIPYLWGTNASTIYMKSKLELTHRQFFPSLALIP